MSCLCFRSQVTYQLYIIDIFSFWKVVNNVIYTYKRLHLLILNHCFASKRLDYLTQILPIFFQSMLVEDQVRKDNLYFYQVGLGSLNTVNSEHWKFKTFSTIKHLLKHHGVSTTVNNSNKNFLVCLYNY